MSLLSYGFVLLFGMTLGMLIFSTTDGVYTWITSINWASQSVANLCAWISGVAATFAAFATAHAAKSSAKAADAATKSVNQWQLQSAYDKYFDIGVKARIKLRWLDAYLTAIGNERFNVFQNNNNVERKKQNDIEGLISCIKKETLAAQELDAFQKYKEIIRHQTDNINKIKSELYDLIEGTYEISKNHVGISENDKTELFKCIEEFIQQVNLISLLYAEIFESQKENDHSKKIHIDCYLKCIDASQHYYRSTLSNLQLIAGYIDSLIINSNTNDWSDIKSKFNSEEVAIYRLITKNGGFNETSEKIIGNRFH